MILDRNELKLFDAAMSLIEFEGNKRLHIVPYSIKYEPPAPDDEAELLDAIFHAPDVLKDIAGHLPPQTPRKVADLIQSWQHPLAGKFTVVQLGPEPLFLGFDRAFAVAGITHSIASVVGKFPAAVDTVLLPFGRFIVYDAYLQTYDMGFSERMKAMFADEATRCKKEGLIVRDGRELAKNAESWIEENSRQSEEQAKHQEELEARDEMPEGCHRGVLAGLSPEERERAVQAQDDAFFEKIDVAGSGESLRKSLRKSATKGTPSHDTAEQLAYYSKQTLQDFARTLGVKAPSKLRKAEIAAQVAQALEVTPGFAEELIAGCDSSEIEALHRVAAAGGTEEFDLADSEGLRAALGMPQLAGLGMLFVSGDTAIYCLSDLLMAKARTLDWDGAEEQARQTERISHRIGAAVYLRGIVPAEDAIEEFGEGLSEAEVTDIIMRSMLDDPGYVLMSFAGDPDAIYMVTYALCDLCYPPDKEDGPAEGFKFEEEMNPLIKQILEGQQGKKPRPLPEGVERDGDLVEWMLRIPEVQELKSYLDAHVPDDADDYLFADDVIERYLDDMQVGMPGTKAIQYYLGVLDDYGLVPTEAVLTQLLNRIMKMMNAVPTWPNNGWSPNELMKQDPGRMPDLHIDTAPIG
ncbi:MAG: hypothetical protein ACI361_04420 [Atopobiaceae bacterium]